MRNLALIPARGGSKRIPRKNIKDFLGKPIIAYSIEAAFQSNLFDEIIVSTDDAEIVEIAEKLGAKVPFLRSDKTADDFATLSDVVEEAKDYYNSNKSDFDNICCILPTAPLITANNILKGYELLINGGFDSVRPVIRFSYPIQRALKLVDGKVEMFYPEYIKARSQDLEPAYHDAGQFYWMKYNKGLKSDNRGAFEISELEAQDIDNTEDWKLAEIKYNLKKII